MKAKRKWNGTRAFVHKSRWKNIIPGDVILYYPLWCSNKVIISQIVSMHEEYALIRYNRGIRRLWLGNLVKIVTKDYPEYLL